MPSVKLNLNDVCEEGLPEVCVCCGDPASMYVEREFYVQTEMNIVIGGIEYVGKEFTGQIPCATGTAGTTSAIRS